MNHIGTYVDFLVKFFKARHPIRVVFDCSNGVTGLVLKELRNKLRNSLEMILINDEPDGNFPAHGPNPLEEGAMDDIERAVIEHGADLGVIFDADGDRAFFIDDKGRRVEPDVSAILMSKNFTGPIILDLRMGYLAHELIAKDGKQVLESGVGHFIIKKLMRKEGVNFAAELSGHYYFSFEDLRADNGVVPVWDSGILATIYMINQTSTLKARGILLSSWIDKLPKYYNSGEINFEVEDKERIIEAVEKKFKVRASKISHIDGLKMEFSSWWFNLRPSQTENLLRLNLEAKDEKVYEEKLAEIKELI